MTLVTSKIGRCLALVALLLGSCGTDIQSGIDNANDLLYRQEYIKAERLYRKLLKRLDSGGPLTEVEEGQRLLVPIDVQLSESEADLVETHSAELSGLGLVVDRAGPESVVVREVPALLVRSDAAQLLRDVCPTLAAWAAANGLKLKATRSCPPWPVTVRCAPTAN